MTLLAMLPFLLFSTLAISTLIFTLVIYSQLCFNHYMNDVRYRNHNELVNQVLLYLHSQFTGRYWSNATGAVKTQSGHFQRYGLKGSTDIIGFTGQGRAVFIEIKTGSGRLSKEQAAFASTVKLNGCIHAVLRENFISEIHNIDLQSRG